MSDVHIKSKELCERCRFFGAETDGAQARMRSDEVPKAEKRHALDCSKVMKNTPCPYFGEAKE